MYNVSANFHTLSIQDAPNTRVRIYFIGDGVDCTDDNDVTTNGTLLKWAVGDTDSNGRIGQDGIKFTEYYNPEYNVTIGRAVSSQVEMTLLNTDGALDNFAYGRCKIYLDVYDSANSTWLSCPMGVYIIDLPTRRKSQLIHAFGYDQMQKLDGICDTWWAGLNFSGGLTLLQIVNSMASQIGVSVSTATATSIVNSSVTYTAAPFDCVETTYREVLELIAEATGTVARFDRDGALDLKWFKAAQISGNTVEIDTDTIGNQCLSIDLAEYQVAAIDLLKVKIAEDDVGVTVGSGTNQYTILDNLFLDGSVATITTRATAIYNRLNALGAYKPIQSNMIWDWSIEAGDIIDITRDSTTYTTPIFQQTMTWRGGYVVSELVNSGDNVRPVPNYDERSTYRMQSEMSAKVGDNEIISKINQSPEAITIQASKVNLTGYVTFTNLSTPGQTVVDGGNITTGLISANRISGGTLTIGGINNTNGIISILDSTGNYAGELANSGLEIISEEPLSSNVCSINVNSYGVILTDIATGNEISRNDIYVMNSTDEYARLWLYGYDNGAEVSRADLVAEPYSGGGYHGAYLRLKGPDGTVRLNSDGTYSGNLSLTPLGKLSTYNVVDVETRRCADSPSFVGWKRAIDFNVGDLNVSKFSVASIIDISIGTTYSNENNCLRRISLCGTYNSPMFLNETSRTTNTNIIDKIRFTRDSSNNGHIDIHYNVANENPIWVSFVSHLPAADQEWFVAGNLGGVADSPSGETVVTEYTFSSNTDGTDTPTAGTYASINAGSYIYRQGKIVYGQISMLTNSVLSSGGWRNLANISDGFRPNTNFDSFLVNNANDTPIHLRILTDGSVNIYPTSNIATGVLLLACFSYLCS